MADGSLDPNQTFMSRIANRKLKMADTFTRTLPPYEHGEPSLMSSFGTLRPRKTHTHTFHKYEEYNHDLKMPTHFIKRDHTHKMDPEKIYLEHMVKMSPFYEMKLKPPQRRVSNYGNPVKIRK